MSRVYTYVAKYRTERHARAPTKSAKSFNMASVIGQGEISGRLSKEKILDPRLYKTIQGQGMIPGHTDEICCLLFDNSGQYIITGACDMSVKVWSTRTGSIIRCLRKESQTCRCTFVIDINVENTLLAAGRDDGTIDIWNLETFDFVTSLARHTGHINSITFCPTRSIGEYYLISVGSDAMVTAWTYSFHTRRNVVFRLVFHQEIEHLDNTFSDYHISASPEGSYLGQRSAVNSIRIWRFKKHIGFEVVCSITTRLFIKDCFKWAHTSMKFVLGAFLGAAIWSIENGTRKKISLNITSSLAEREALQRWNSSPTVCWNASDQYVIIAILNYKIWNSHTGQLTMIISGPCGMIRLLEPHPHNRNIVLSVGQNQQLIVLNINKVEQLCSFNLNSTISFVKWSPDGCLIAAGNTDGHIIISQFLGCLKDEEVQI